MSRSPRMTAPVTRRELFDLIGAVQSLSLNTSLAVLALASDDKEMARKILRDSISVDRELLDMMRRLAGVEEGSDGEQ